MTAFDDHAPLAAPISPSSPIHHSAVFAIHRGTRVRQCCAWLGLQGQEGLHRVGTTLRRSHRTPACRAARRLLRHLPRSASSDSLYVQWGLRESSEGHCNKAIDATCESPVCVLFFDLHGDVWADWREMCLRRTCIEDEMKGGDGMKELPLVAVI